MRIGFLKVSGCGHHVNINIANDVETLLEGGGFRLITPKNEYA
jgi:hypothetical protein